MEKTRKKGNMESISWKRTKRYSDGGIRSNKSTCSKKHIIIITSVYYAVSTVYH